MDYCKYLIHKDENIVSALKYLNQLSGDALVIFIYNDENQIIGSLTDGDIRRALINGTKLDAPVVEIMNSHFSFISERTNRITETIKELKTKGIQVIPLLNDRHELIRLYNLRNLRSVLPVDAILMAGGKGERLRPLTEKKPKPLLPVGDKCIIDYNVDSLISYGIEHISVTCNYLKEQLYEHFKDPRSGIKVNCVTEPEFLGTIGSIKYVDTIYNDSVLVMNSDLFTDVDYEDFYLHFKEHNADMSVAAIPYTVSIPYGIMELDGRDLKGIREKPTYNYYANAGIYLIKRDKLDLIPKDTFFHATDLINKILENGGKIIRFPINGTWIDIGNPQEYQKAKELVRHLKRINY